MRLPTLITVFLAAAAACAQELPQPTVYHKEMAREVGEWDAKCTMWQSPDAEPVESTGSETISMLGSMWTVGKFDGDFAGMPFTGHSQLGYDPVEKEYIGTWIDSISPYMMSMRGTYDPQTHKLEMATQGRDWMTNEPCAGRVVTTYHTNDSKTFEMYGPDKSGKEFLHMRIEYTRRAE